MSLPAIKACPCGCAANVITIEGLTVIADSGSDDDDADDDDEYWCKIGTNVIMF